MIKIEFGNSNKPKWTYHKWMTTINVFLSWVCIFLMFGFAWYGRAEYLVEVVVAMVTLMLGNVVQYSVKSFKETNAEENIKLERDKMERADGSPTMEDNVAG